jgi:hypothetical protein
MPFVQGRLRNAPLTVTIRTECGHCGEPLQIELTHELHFKLPQGPREPLVFQPFVDLDSLKDPSIIDAF